MNFEADAVPSDALVRISSMAAIMSAQAAAVESADAALRAAKDALRRTEMEDLPELMRELGLSEIKLLDGSKVAVLDDLSCGITEERNGAAMAWLEGHAFGGLIKSELRVAFGRDELEDARSAAERLAEELQREVVLKDGVHPATLKAFLKEQAAAGALTPEMITLFGVHQFSRAKLTPPTKRRSAT